MLTSVATLILELDERLMFCTLIPRRSPTRTDNALPFLDFEVKDKTDGELMAEIATACRVHAAAVAVMKKAMQPNPRGKPRCLRRSGSARLDIDLWRRMDRCVPNLHSGLTPLWRGKSRCFTSPPSTPRSDVLRGDQRRWLPDADELR